MSTRTAKAASALPSPPFYYPPHIKRAHAEILMTGGLLVLSIAAAAGMSMGQAFWLAAAALVTAGVWLYPRTALALLLWALPFLPVFKAARFAEPVSLVKDVVIVALFVHVVLLPWLIGFLPYRRNPLWGLLILLPIWGGVGLALAPSKALGLVRWRDTVLYLLLALVVLYLWRRRELPYLRSILVGSLSLALVLALLQAAFWPQGLVLRQLPVWQIWVPRLSGTLGHPTTFGQGMLLLAGLTLGRALFARKRAYLFCAAAATLAAVGTFSRTVWLGLAVIWAGIFLLSWMQRGERKKIALFVLAAVLLGGGALLYAPLRHFGQSWLSWQYGSNQARWAIWGEVTREAEGWRLWFGSGLGAPRFLVSETERRGGELEGAHLFGRAAEVRVAKGQTLVDNQWLKLVVEQGMLGLAFWLTLQVSVLVLGWRVVRQLFAGGRKTAKVAALAAGIWLYLLVFFLQSPFVDIWDLVPPVAWWWLGVGVLLKLIHPPLSRLPAAG
jgi:O-antigen ligase